MNSTSPSDATAAPAPPCVVPNADPAQWFESQVHPHGPQLKAYLEGKFPAIRSEVDDITQESYLKALRRQAVRPLESVKGFLFTAARHLAIDLLRKHRRSPIDPSGSLVLPDVIDERPSAPEVLTQNEKFELLIEAVAQLPDRCYQVIHLHKFQGLSQREVAQKLGISERTVQGHMLRALQLCSDYLRSQGVKGVL